MQPNTQQRLGNDKHTRSQIKYSSKFCFIRVELKFGHILSHTAGGTWKFKRLTRNKELFTFQLCPFGIEFFDFHYNISGFIVANFTSKIKVQNF
jgi:hypothetical protein